MVSLCALVLGAGIVLLWPPSHWRMSLWFWCCVLVFPWVPGILAYGLRRLAYERRSDYANSWNQRHDAQEQVLIRQGRCAVGLLATSYCSGAGRNKMAQALRRGSKPLQPVYLALQDQTLRLSQWVPHAQHYTQDEYRQRLEMSLQQVLVGLDPELQRYTAQLPLAVRIRHNQVLGDEELLSLWRSLRGGEYANDQVFFAEQDDGLMWLDTRLDGPPDAWLLLSLEINLFLEPIAEQAESLSAVLLASAHACTKHAISPQAWVHRPVQMVDPLFAVQDALFWGRLQAGSTRHFTWLTQLPADVARDGCVALSSAGYPLDVEQFASLDDSFGMPACAVGNVVLILASEHASSERLPQVVMLKDASPQVLVIQPA